MWMKYVKETTALLPQKKEKTSTSNNINLTFPKCGRRGWRLAEQHVPWCCDVLMPGNHSAPWALLPLSHLPPHLSQVCPEGVLPTYTLWSLSLWNCSSSPSLPLDPDTTLAWCAHSQKAVQRSSPLDPSGERCQETSFDRCHLSKAQVDDITHTCAHFQSVSQCLCLRNLESQPFLLDT